MTDEIPSNIKVEQFRQDWALALMSQGVIVKLSIKRWRALSRLTPQLLGMSFIDEESYKASQKYIRLGQQKLLPPIVLSELNTIESRARACLENYSFNTVWGRFVPFTAFEAWQQEDEIIKNDFRIATENFGLKYDDIISEVKKDYRNVARDVWARLYPESKSSPTESFVEDFVNRIVAKIPARDDLLATFLYDSTFFIIPMPSMIEANVARAEEIKLESEMKKFESELSKKTKQKIADDYTKKKKELIDGFLDATVNEMRKYIVELCEAVLISIGQKSAMKDVNDVSRNVIDRLKNMIKRVRYLNFYNDKEMTEKLNELETEIEKFKGERNKGIIKEKLQSIVELSKSEFCPKDFNPTLGYIEIE